MQYAILLLEAAIKDLEAICRWIQKSGDKMAAKEMVKNIRLDPLLVKGL